MKVKFKDVMCMGNKTYLADDTAEVSDITGQQLIEKGYAEAVDGKDESDDKSKAAKKTTKKAE